MAVSDGFGLSGPQLKSWGGGSKDQDQRLCAGLLYALLPGMSSGNVTPSDMA
jgi:hypothetical protein